jgi:phosphoribosylformylglycinamidine synthase
VLPGIIAGVGGYGNCLGLPNIGGEVTFDETYAGNPLVNALCVGVMKHSDIKLAKAAGAGNLVVLYGAKTGGDGIGGVSVLASETFGAGGSTKRPSVQVGDPFVEKVLIECSLEIFAEDLVVGIQDLGGAGLSCATSELASGGSGGMKVQLDKVPLRDPSLSPEEILMSESQERMCAIVEPNKIDRFLEICKKWDVTVTVIGEVTDGKHLEITWNGELIVDVPPRTVAHDGPVYNRPLAQPAYIDQVNGQKVNVPIPASTAEIKAAVLKLAAAPNLADKSWVTSQYDKYVQGNTIQSQPDDSGMVRIDETTHLGVAISTDANANWSYLNPYQGAKLALAEAARNIATAGARPLAVTNCLNFGSPEDPGVMWQFAESVRGLADGCLEMGLPVTGGNVSFYNQTGLVAILPTPVIGVLGVIQDVRTRTPMSFTKAGLDLYLVGETHEDLAGSEWAFLHNQRVGQSPDADLQREMRLIELLLEGNSFFAAAHDLSQGGLSAGLTEMVLRHKVGVTISLDNPGVSLISETPGRVLVAIDPSQTAQLEALAVKNSIAITKLGTTGGDALVINDAVIPLSELSHAHTSTFPRLFG